MHVFELLKNGEKSSIIEEQHKPTITEEINSSFSSFVQNGLLRRKKINK